MGLREYAGQAARTATDLVNSYDVMTGVDRLATGEAAAKLLAARGWVVDNIVSAADLDRLRTVRHRLRFAFDSPGVQKAVVDLNRMLQDLGAQPQLTDHDGGWHWHYTRPQAPLSDRVATTCVVALLSLIADGGADRLRVCSGVDCGNVFIDTSRPGTRRFCDTKGCGNRAHVSAYRQRQRQRPEPTKE